MVKVKTYWVFYKLPFLLYIQYQQSYSATTNDNDDINNALTLQSYTATTNDNDDINNAASLLELPLLIIMKKDRLFKYFQKNKNAKIERHYYKRVFIVHRMTMIKTQFVNVFHGIFVSTYFS